MRKGVLLTFKLRMRVQTLSRAASKPVCAMPSEATVVPLGTPASREQMLRRRARQQSNSLLLLSCHVTVRRQEVSQNRAAIDRRFLNIPVKLNFALRGAT